MSKNKKFYPLPTSNVLEKLWFILKHGVKLLHNLFLTVANARNGWRRIKEIVTVV